MSIYAQHANPGLYADLIDAIVTVATLAVMALGAAVVPMCKY